MQRNSDTVGVLSSIRKRFNDVRWACLSFRSNNSLNEPSPGCLNKTPSFQCQCCGPIAAQEEEECTSKVLNIDPSVVGTTERLQYILDSHTNPEHVHEVHLRNSAIDSIPPAIGKFINLKVLDLSNNSIQEIPWFIVYLRNLEVLDLSFNVLKSLPKILGFLTNLRSLILRGNCINSLPTCLLRLNNLQVLDVSQTNMVSQPITGCLQEKEATFRKLRLRQRRSDIWSLSTPWYQDDPHIQTIRVKDLQEICISCILECRMNFVTLKNVAPALKTRLNDVEKAVQSTLELKKCSVCQKCFSNALSFEYHVC